MYILSVKFEALGKLLSGSKSRQLKGFSYDDDLCDSWKTRRWNGLELIVRLVTPTTDFNSIVSETDEKGKT